MSQQSDVLLPLLDKQGFIILDGALATELERRGYKLNTSLWSAEVLIKNPRMIQQVHLDYFLAGADVATTSSYQVSDEGLEDAGLSTIDASKLVKRSVELAMKARLEANEQQPDRKLIVAGSIGPYGAYLANGAEYRGDYRLSEDQFKAFHRPRMRALVEAGVDVLAIETIPSFPETLALQNLLSEFPGARAWFSFTLKDSGHISDGTSLRQVADVLETSNQITAIGVNCVPPESAIEALQLLSGLTKKPLVVYPNSGESYDASSKKWNDKRKDRYDLATLAPKWFSAGAKFIGGCCRMTPTEIRNVRRALESIAKGSDL
jgi:homocysteine S-methyltransferase